MAHVRSLGRAIRGELTERLRALGELATHQGGVVALWQLLELGFSSDTVHRWLACGRLHRIHRGVYAVGHGALPLRGRLMGAVVACGPETTLSHRDGAGWWAILPTNRARVDVTSPGRHRLPGIDAHRARLDPIDRTVHEGIPITTVARTLLDLAEVVPERRLAQAVETAERRGLFDLNAVEDVLRRSPGRHGQRPLRSVLGHYTPAPLTRSELEDAFWALLKEEDLPRPQPNAAVGPYEVDFLWEDQRLIVERDSWEFHGTKQAFERDRERDLELQLAGYTVIRVTYRRLVQDRKRLASQLRTLLARR
jgi:very-short-patch-repair endonuclease